MQRFRKVALLATSAGTAVKGAVKGTAAVAEKGSQVAWRGAQGMTKKVPKPKPGEVPEKPVAPHMRAVGLLGLGGASLVGGKKIVGQNIRSARGQTEGPWR